MYGCFSWVGTVIYSSLSKEGCWTAFSSLSSLGLFVTCGIEWSMKHQSLITYQPHMSCVVTWVSWTGPLWLALPEELRSNQVQYHLLSHLTRLQAGFHVGIMLDCFSRFQFDLSGEFVIKVAMTMNNYVSVPLFLFPPPLFMCSCVLVSVLLPHKMNTSCYPHSFFSSLFPQLHTCTIVQAPSSVPLTCITFMF